MGDVMGVAGEDGTAEAADLPIDLADLWSAELCAWHVDYDSGAGNPWPWEVVLEWTQEDGNAHGADWITYRWHFRGETVEVALSAAVGWCWDLVPWAPCRECDGLGVWKDEPCESCDGTGFPDMEDHQ